MENNTFFATIAENNILSIDGSAVSDSVKFIKIRFSFPATWDGFTKTVVFKNGDTKCSVILDEKSELCIGEDECYIPHEVIKTPMLSFAVFGIFEDSKATSSWAAIRIIKGCGENGDAPLDPTPTEYEQLLKISEETKKIAQSVRDDADNGAFKGEKGDTGAKGDKGEKGATGATGAKGDKGEKGDAFTYEDFTAEQLAALKGAKGDKGDKGEKGDTGDVNTLQMNTACANALRGAASDSSVSLTDISPNEHTLGVKVGGKNLLSVMSLYPTITNNATPIHFKARQTYILSMTSTYEQYRIMLFGTDINGTQFNATNPDNNKYIQGMYTGNTGRLQSTSNQTAKTLSLKCNTDCIITAIVLWNAANESEKTYSNFQLELGSTATAYTPYISDLTSVTVTRSGKNLIPYPYFKTTQTISGVTFTVNSDGSITVNGTAAANAVFELESDLTTFALPVGNYFLSGCPSGGSVTSYFMVAANGAGISYDKFLRDFGNGITAPSNGENWKISIRIMSGYTANNLVFKPQIELGSTATAYEPYTVAEYTPAADGTVSGITSLYPTTTLMTNAEGAIIEAEYNRDINKAFAELQQAILSMGGNT